MQDHASRVLMLRALVLVLFMGPGWSGAAETSITRASAEPANQSGSPEAEGPPAPKAGDEPAKKPEVSEGTGKESPPPDAQPDENGGPNRILDSPSVSDSIAVGTDVLVILNTGQRLKGVFISMDRRELTVRIGMIEARLPRGQVERVIPQLSARERYHEMRAVIEDSDIDRLLALCEWLRTNRLFAEARLEMDHVLTLEPTNPDAIRLSRLIHEEQKLDEQPRARRRDSGRESGDRLLVRRTERLLPSEFPLLTESQANLLKVWEIDLTNPPKLVIPRLTTDKLLDRYGDDPTLPTTQDARETFHRRAPVEILKEMFRLRARDLYGEVQVVGMPDSLQRFREDVNGTWLINNCSTTRCHGGTEAGELMLYNRQPRAERPALTNFLIVDRFRTAAGRPLIDYENPERSPLLQLGLPRAASAFPHPEVDGWRPAFSTMDSRGFGRTIDWIRSMPRPRTDSPIDYTPPTARRATNETAATEAPNEHLQPR